MIESGALREERIEQVAPQLACRIAERTGGIRVNLHEQSIASGRHRCTCQREYELRLPAALARFCVSAGKLDGVRGIKDNGITGIAHDLTTN